MGTVLPGPEVKCSKSLWLFLLFQAFSNTEDHRSQDFRLWYRYLCSEARAAPIGLQQSQTLRFKSGICKLWSLGYIYCRNDKTNKPSKCFSLAASLSLKRRGSQEPCDLNETDGPLPRVGHVTSSESFQVILCLPFQPMKGWSGLDGLQPLFCRQLGLRGSNSKQWRSKAV